MFILLASVTDDDGHNSAKDDEYIYDDAIILEEGETDETEEEEIDAYDPETEKPTEVRSDSAVTDVFIASSDSVAEEPEKKEHASAKLLLDLHETGEKNLRVGFHVSSHSISFVCYSTFQMLRDVAYNLCVCLLLPHSALGKCRSC